MDMASCSDGEGWSIAISNNSYLFERRPVRQPSAVASSVTSNRRSMNRASMLFKRFKSWLLRRKEPIDERRQRRSKESCVLRREPMQFCRFSRVRDTNKITVDCIQRASTNFDSRATIARNAFIDESDASFLNNERVKERTSEGR